MLCSTVEKLNADMFGTKSKCPDYPFFRGFKLSNASCLGSRDSVLFIEASLFQGVHIYGFHSFQL